MLQTVSDRDGSNVVVVGVGKLEIAEHPLLLMTPALGSCVGVTVYDRSKRRGAMAHVMLPSDADTRMHGDSTRFATVAVPRMIEELGRMGSPVRRLEAKLAGGAAMFRGESGVATIGSRNAAEVRDQLERLGVPVVAEDTGGNYARTIELHLDTGLLLVRSYLYGVREL